jgi:hypothetical protein
MRNRFCEIQFAFLKHVCCIETQINNKGFEKRIWDITGTHTDRQTHRQHEISQNNFFLVWNVA